MAPATGGALFGDINALKSVEDDEDNDEDERQRAKFDETTIWGRISVNKHFEYSTLGVIVFNALYLGYDCDYNARWGKPDDLYASTLWGFILCDNCFCLFFTAEVVIRFLGYKSKVVAFKDVAFLFDLFLVLLMIAETWILAFVGQIDALKQVSILRLLRLARLLRMGKLMRYFPELGLIVKGMLSAVRAVGCAGILLFLVLYVFAIIFTNEYHIGLKEEDDITDAEELFGSIGKSLRHLLIMATILDDLTACTNAIRATDKMHMLMWFMLCVLISSFTLFNMLLGILCEVVEATQNGEQAKAESSRLSDTMRRFFKAMDMDGNGQICKAEFLQMSQSQHIMETLVHLEIKPADFKKYANVLFAPKHAGGKPPVLDFDQACSMIMRLRPGQIMNACDFRHFEKQVLQHNKDIHAYLNNVEQLLADCASLEEDEEEEHAMDFHEDHAREGSPSGKRGVMTLGRLARDDAAFRAAEPPPVFSRWQQGPKIDRFVRSQSPMQSGADIAKEDTVKERVQQLAQMRRAKNNDVFETMYGSNTNQMNSPSSYSYGFTMPAHIAPPVDTSTAFYANNGNGEEESDDDAMPFSPNGFVLD